jgi:hypothetical protein
MLCVYTFMLLVCSYYKLHGTFYTQLHVLTFNIIMKLQHVGFIDTAIKSQIHLVHYLELKIHIKHNISETRSVSVLWCDE